MIGVPPCVAQLLGDGRVPFQGGCGRAKELHEPVFWRRERHDPQGSLHLVRVIAGTLVRGTPLWTSHLRLNGARLGKRVYVNSLSVSDYNLIECGNDAVIGGGVHLSGHTVEAGVVKTARVRLGNNVTIGLGTVIEIGVEIDSDSQVGALSFVPKYTKLKGGLVYAGIPAMPIE